MGSGSAYEFVRSGGVWTQQQKLTANDGATNDFFGSSVAVGGDTLVVGASGGQGFASVFGRSGGVWTEQQKLTASDGAIADQFGFSVAIDGGTIIVGALRDDVGANPNQGSAYVFLPSGGVWTEEQKLTASDGVAGDLFGNSVAIDGNTLVVGANSHDVGANPNQGSAYLFLLSGSAWTQQQLTASDGAAVDLFGSSVAVGGGTIAVGAVGDDVDANVNQGSTYVFALDTVPVAVVLSPPAGVNDVGTSHTVTATVTDAAGQPVVEALVRFTVSGSVSAAGSCTTDSNGQCDFSYGGPSLPGADLIEAYADTDGDSVQDTDEPAAEATMAWTLPSSTAGRVHGAGHLESSSGEKIAFGFHAKSTDMGVEGDCNVVDRAADRKIKCLDVTAVVITGNRAMLYGNALDGGTSTTYVIDVTDNGNPGKGNDTFSITTGSGYAAGGTLAGGNVDVNA